ncbi:MAG: imidazole glycerol phosphate synthase cyclase subunit [Proteobacteria bacterium]|nr:imidazole glycerol phosphate synthase cyclase subunit [Pseudomonadota bacterium]MBU1738774.1 imidazole glycerol phosphate synthase cyclase subunit [Pseudomonadota bacterium]
MLKIRVVPVLLLKDGRMIKTKKFQFYRDTGDPNLTVRVYDAQGADELLFLDISATVEGRGQLYSLVSQSAKQCFIPITVGGGIRSVEDARRTFSVGADRISISTEAVVRPEFVNELAETFGCANIVVCIDAKLDHDGRYLVSSHCGTRLSNRDPVTWAGEMAERGAGEILLHFVDRDGMMNGYDLELLEQITRVSRIPVMALGGVGTLQDFLDGVKIGKASAVSAASIFHFTDQSPIKAHSYLYDRGIPVCLA